MAAVFRAWRPPYHAKPPPAAARRPPLLANKLIIQTELLRSGIDVVSSITLSIANGSVPGVVARAQVRLRLVGLLVVITDPAPACAGEACVR